MITMIDEKFMEDFWKRMYPERYDDKMTRLKFKLVHIGKEKEI